MSDETVQERNARLMTLWAEQRRWQRDHGAALEVDGAPDEDGGADGWSPEETTFPEWKIEVTLRVQAPTAEAAQWRALGAASALSCEGQSISVIRTVGRL